VISIFFAALVTIVQAIDVDTEPRYIVTSVLVMLGTAITVFSLFVQKAFFVYKNVSTWSGGGAASFRTRRASSVVQSQNHTSSKDQTSSEMKRLHEKVEAVRHKKTHYFPFLLPFFKLTDRLELLRESVRNERERGDKYKKACQKLGEDVSSTIKEQRHFLTSNSFFLRRW